jgi:hypothetical protein
MVIWRQPVARNIWDTAPQFCGLNRPVTGKVWATAPQFCGLKILRDGIHGGADLRGSVQAFNEVGGEALGGL